MKEVLRLVKSHLDPALRQEIRASTASVKDLAHQYGVTEKTVRKWRKRDDFEDRSHCTRRVLLGRDEIQELIVCELRVLLQLPLDDLLTLSNVIFRQAIPRATLARRLKQNRLNKLKELVSDDDNLLEAETPGTFLITVCPLPQWCESKHRRYLFAAIDVCTRWIFAKAYDQEGASSYVDFLYRAQNAARMGVRGVLLESCLSNACALKTPFADACEEQGIALGFYRRISASLGGDRSSFERLLDEKLDRTRFPTPESLELAIQELLTRYNHQFIQTTLGGKSPNTLLSAWSKKLPDNFYHKNCLQALGNQGAYLFLELERLIGNSWTWAQRIDLAKGIQKRFSPVSVSGKRNEINKLAVFQWTKRDSTNKENTKKEPKLEKPTASLEYVVTRLLIKSSNKNLDLSLNADYVLFLLFERKNGVLLHSIIEHPLDQTQVFDKLIVTLNKADKLIRDLSRNAFPMSRKIFFPEPAAGNPQFAYLKNIPDDIFDELGYSSTWIAKPTGLYWYYSTHQTKNPPPLFVEANTIAEIRQWLEDCRQVISNEFKTDYPRSRYKIDSARVRNSIWISLDTDTNN